MRIIACLFVFCLSFSTYSSAQSNDSEQSHFLVEFDKFTPPTQDLVSNFEGQPAETFLASDINGKEHFLSDYRGKKMILWFWDTEDVACRNHLVALNKLAEANKAELQIISFARKGSADIRKFTDVNPVSFPVIANADVFGQMAYGADLGYPRYFFIDEFGIVKVVLPDQAFAGEPNLFNGLSAILGGI